MISSYQQLNEQLLQFEALLLNNASNLLTLQQLQSIHSAGVPYPEAYALGLAAMAGIDVDGSPEGRRFVYEMLLPCLHHFSPEDFSADPYLQTIRFPASSCGSVQYKSMEYAPCELFPCGETTHLPSGRIVAPLGFFTQKFAYPAILEGGRIWMTVNPNEILTMRQPVLEARGRVLVYGLGLGYYAFMISQKPEVESITIVELNQSIIDIFTEEILPQFPQSHKISILCNDAFRHAEATRFEGFDTVFADIWHDVSDGLPLYRRFKQHEQLNPAPRYTYWIEPTLQSYM